MRAKPHPASVLARSANMFQMLVLLYCDRIMLHLEPMKRDSASVKAKSLFFKTCRICEDEREISKLVRCFIQ
uniref:Uncharacterized protein n=1 Tax=Candidatus Kentrum sp. LFY TaxID=2126342 RepID=A0A450UBC0_9GAMM|nr:MAG: hypothetical protein BECKLFY1418A_GA0070994_10087 [Candidatus Kentron sp. LFY]